MLEVRAFRGLTFDTGKTGSQDAIITPPYDVIGPEERAILAAKSPYNLVHVQLPMPSGDASPYENAEKIFEGWLKDGVLVQDGQPHFYLLRQHFTDIEGVARTRRGFFAAVKIPEAEERIILGHERTFAKPVEDRLKLTAALQANLGAVFALYDDDDAQLAAFLGQMEQSEPHATATTIDGVRQEFWRVDDDPVVTRFFENKTLYIADGHHRFQTAGIYRDQMRAAHPEATGLQPYDYVLMGFVALNDPGLKIYPAHRLVPQPAGFDAAKFVEALKPWFDVESMSSDALPERLASDPAACAIGLVIHGAGACLLKLRDIDRTTLLGSDRGPAWRDLDVAVLHRGIIERVLGIAEGAEFVYEKNLARAIEAAETGSAGLSFLLRSVKPSQVQACARDTEPMPQKSTYFFPKLPSGGVLNRLI